MKKCLYHGRLGRLAVTHVEVECNIEVAIVETRIKVNSIVKIAFSKARIVVICHAQVGFHLCKIPCFIIFQIFNKAATKTKLSTELVMESLFCFISMIFLKFHCQMTLTDLLRGGGGGNLLPPMVFSISITFDRDKIFERNLKPPKFWLR